MKIKYINDPIEVIKNWEKCRQQIFNRDMLLCKIGTEEQVMYCILLTWKGKQGVVLELQHYEDGEINHVPVNESSFQFYFNAFFEEAKMEMESLPEKIAEDRLYQIIYGLIEKCIEFDPDAIDHDMDEYINECLEITPEEYEAIEAYGGVD